MWRSRAASAATPWKPRSQAPSDATSIMPMLVGEVRCATSPSGSSWWLSGGSQWSSGPTKVSKKSQVRRARRRRKARSASASAGGARRRGRPVRSAISGDASHRSSTGAAARRAPGRRTASRGASASARAGPGQSARHMRARSGRRSQRASCAAGVHSSRRRPLTNTRHSVRTIASSATSASGTTNTIASSQRPAWSRSARSVPDTAPRRRPRPSPVTSSVNSEAAGASTASAVHRSGWPGRSSQPPRSSATSAGGTRLRRRLSAIFQRSSAPSRFGRRLPPGPGTRRPSQRTSCQSPRTQRCQRRAQPR